MSQSTRGQRFGFIIVLVGLVVVVSIITLVLIISLVRK